MNPRPFYEQCWDILVKHAGASSNPHDKEYFVRYCVETRSLLEFRFCGVFGFGGKFRRNDGRHYIDYYPEDRTRRLDRLAQKVNELIAALTRTSRTDVP